MRINRFIASTGLCSRRAADALIEQGVVEVNGMQATPGTNITPEDKVTVHGKPLEHAVPKRVYLAYHKPVGIITTSDPNAKDNIIDAINYPERIFHIGRLDVASSGLILLTNDGDIVNKILRSENEHEKEYQVKVDKEISRRFIDEMKRGVDIGDYITKPARVKQTGARSFTIVLTEGKNRQIRRMCEALGYNAVSLKRVRIMNIRLGTLGAGNIRKLTKSERRELLDTL